MLMRIGEILIIMALALTLQGHDIKHGGHNLKKKRLWRMFDKERFVKKIRETNWTDILEEANTV